MGGESYSFLSNREKVNDNTKSEGETKRKTTWFYNPETLSEYKIPFLDVAFNNQVLNDLRPAEEYDNEYIKLIFSGIMPSSTVFKTGQTMGQAQAIIEVAIVLCRARQLLPVLQETFHGRRGKLVQG